MASGTHREGMPVSRGRVIWFSGEKGFGFIEDGGGEQIFVHFTGIEGDGFRSLEEGAEVEFTVVRGRRGRKEATGVRPAGKGEES